MVGQFTSIDINRPFHLTTEEYFVKKRTYKLHKVDGEEFSIMPTLFELNLLKLLAIQKVMSLRQIKRLYNEHFPFKEDSITRKFLRWKDAGVLLSHNPYEETMKYAPKLYGVDRAGLRLLVDNGYLSRDWLDEDAYKIVMKPKKPIHSIGIRDVVVELLAELENKGANFKSVSPISYFGVDEKTLGIPDWMLRYNESESDGNDMDFYIEFDNHTESVNVLETKLRTYIERANQNPSANIHLLLSFVDHSFHYALTQRVPTKEKLRNLKLRFLNDLLPSNLTMNIHYRARASHAVRDIISPVDKEEFILPLIEHFNNSWDFKVQEISSDGFYRREVPNEHYADSILEIRDNEQKLKERIGVIVVSEGDLHSFQKVKGFYSAIKGRLFDKTIHRLILLYKDYNSMYEDILDTDLKDYLLLTNRTALLDGDSKPFNRIKQGFTTVRTAYPFD